MNHIGLIDCDNFFVSCERLFRPDLLNKPVVVLSSNDGCVVARSQEVKDKGVPMGAPYFQVKDTLSDIGACIFSSNFSLYRDISRRVFSIMAQEFKQVEQYSIDECFFMLDQSHEIEVVSQVQQRIETEVGIPVSIGIGLSKTRAKIATAVAKKTRQIVRFETDISTTDFMEMKLATIWGVGRGRSVAFEAKKITTVADYLAQSERSLGTWFGVEGVRLLGELQGISASKVQARQPVRKTQVSSQSFSLACSDRMMVREALLGHLHKVVSDMAKESMVATSVRIMLYPDRYGDYILQGVSKEVLLHVPSNNIMRLAALVGEIFDQVYTPGVPYKKAGVAVNIIPSSAQTRSLFVSHDELRTASLATLLHRINRRQGKEAIRVGILKTPDRAPWVSRKDKRSPDYTTRWSDLRKVLAKDSCFLCPQGAMSLLGEKSPDK